MPFALYQEACRGFQTILHPTVFCEGKKDCLCSFLATTVFFCEVLALPEMHCVKERKATELAPRPPHWLWVGRKCFKMSVLTVTIQTHGKFWRATCGPSNSSLFPFLADQRLSVFNSLVPFSFRLSSGKN